MQLRQQLIVQHSQGKGRDNKIHENKGILSCLKWFKIIDSFNIQKIDTT